MYQTLLAANRAAQYVSDHAWSIQQFHQYDLQRECYREIRRRFGLCAQIATLVIIKVANAYKAGKAQRRTFTPLGSIAYDLHVLTWRSDDSLSIWTVTGRVQIPYVAGDRQSELLQYAKSQAFLVHRKNIWYIHQVCEVPASPQLQPTEWLGVDCGVVNLAVDSDGNVYSGKLVTVLRLRRRRQRSRLQVKGSRSAKRVLRQLSGREHRYATDLNHQIGKRIVALAKQTQRGVVLEDLKGIRDRAQTRRNQRAQLHSWAFYQLHEIIQYKATLVGVPVIRVDPRNSSRRCSLCGYTDKANRITQDLFSCRRCGYTLHADLNAAINLRAGVQSTTRTDQTRQLVLPLLFYV